MQKRKKIKQFGNPDLLAELMPNVSVVRPQLKFLFSAHSHCFSDYSACATAIWHQNGKETQRHRSDDCSGRIQFDDGAGHTTLTDSRKQNRYYPNLWNDMTNDKVGLVVFRLAMPTRAAHHG